MQKRSQHSLYSFYSSREECPTAETGTILSYLHPLHWHTCLKNHLCVRRGKWCVLTEQEQWCFNPWHLAQWSPQNHWRKADSQFVFSYFLLLSLPIMRICVPDMGCTLHIPAEWTEFPPLLQWNKHRHTELYPPFQSGLRGHLPQWLWYLQLTDHSKKEEGKHLHDKN